MKKALLFGLLWWIIIFVEVSAIGFTPGLATQGEYGFTLLPAGIAAHFVIVAGLAWALARLYFRKVAADIPSAAKVAAIIAIVGLVLDAVITVPFFVKDYAHYYSKWTLWVGLALFVGAFVVGSPRTSAVAKDA